MADVFAIVAKQAVDTDDAVVPYEITADELTGLLAAAGAPADASSASTQIGLLKAVKAAVTGTLTITAGALTDGTQKTKVVDGSGNVLGTPANPSSVKSGTLPVTSVTRDTAGRVTAFTEDGVVWTVARDASGNMTSVTHA
jgi:YD repeat-containing protein